MTERESNRVTATKRSTDRWDGEKQVNKGKGERERYRKRQRLRIKTDKDREGKRKRKGVFREREGV